MCLHPQLCRIVLSLLAILMLASCDNAEPPDESEPPVNISVLTIQPQLFRVVEDLPGRVAAVRTAEIRPQVSGIVQSRQFEQGTEVAAGSVLFQINQAPFKAEVDMAAATLLRAQAVLSHAKVQTGRLAPLVRTGAISQQVYDDAISLRDQASADVAQASATLARRALDLKFSTVDAPISGRIDQALVTEGALVAPTDSKPMATIQQINQVYVDVRQSAASLESLRHSMLGQSNQDDKGLPAEILNSAGNLSGLTGHILFSGVNVDAGTGDVLLRILVDNPQRQLLPGMYVQARVTRAIYPQALVIPQQAVTRAGGQAHVWIVDKHNQVKLVNVVLGELVDRHYRIISGPAAGQQVVIEGSERLKEGATVETHSWLNPEPSPTIASQAH